MIYTGEPNENGCGYLDNNGKWRNDEGRFPGRYVCERLGQ